MAHIIGLMLTRNSDWIIGFSLRAAMRWVDGMVVMLHNCTDRTLDIAHQVAAEFPDKIVITTVEDPFWNLGATLAARTSRSSTTTRR